MPFRCPKHGYRHSDFCRYCERRSPNKQDRPIIHRLDIPAAEARKRREAKERGYPLPPPRPIAEDVRACLVLIREELRIGRRRAGE